MNNTYQSIGLFIDGGYYAKVNEALSDHFDLNINLRALMTLIREQIARMSGVAPASCHITETHDKRLLYSERKFEDTLIENDVIFHYKHLREIRKEGEVTVIEKGIDVWFALEAYELALFRKFDYVVLITGDADHEMLIKKLKALKIETILLTWDVEENSSTSGLLKDEACIHLEISKLLAEDRNLLKRLCQNG